MGQFNGLLLWLLTECVIGINVLSIFPHPIKYQEDSSHHDELVHREVLVSLEFLILLSPYD